MSDYPITYDYIDSKWRQRPGGNRLPRYGVAHDTGNPGSTARQNVNYFNRQNLSSSAHAFVDDREIIVMIPFTEKAYHVRYDVSDANDWAIGIELCYGGQINFKEAYKRYVWLWAYLCNRFNFNPRTQIKGHYMLDPTRRSDPINAFSKNQITWNQFINDVQKRVGQPIMTAPTTIILREGDRGENVTEVQRQLSYLGYYKDSIDGSFGPNTRNAVIQFQREQNLIVDGIVGPMTFGALNDAYENKESKEPLQRGDQGTRVETLQRQLTSLGYTPGPLDGRFGPQTESAVRAFQRDQGLAIDGSFGPLTMAALNNALTSHAASEDAPSVPKPSPANETLYRVQVGVFESERNAQELASKVRGQGFDVTVIPFPKADP
ncbi:peptidoglycan-binding protein [Halobacillus locisalis]|uniref:N-acetylmuramoyl-L-alanine amidase n=1 Tax=Halobacillus locisalis TaxID=220753 RepID=A0A838CZS5_9BACI|nr:peptidoglycan-binding protein [Halobacillus locisalis]